MSKTKKKKSNIPFIIIFIIGFIILLYPQVSRIYYRVDATKEVKTFDEEKEKLSDKEVRRRIRLAQGYNKSLNNTISSDPYEEKQKEEGRAEYARMLEINEQIGHIQIPEIDVDIPIYAGTSEEVLQKGAGHLEGTSLPIGGVDTHTVITAHSGLPTARLFTDLNKLKKGDKFYIHNLERTIAYEVDQIKTVLPSEFDDLLIVKGKDYATLLTCTPIMINSHRLLVRGHRVEYDETLRHSLETMGRRDLILRYAFYISIFLIIVLLLSDIHYYRKKNMLLREYRKLMAMSDFMGGNDEE